ncbi:hypothetical protein [Stygiolobus caldivivus]|uniref:Uncharacterized protein n=1 Tax=Stygiolobus caldivivus TaxID=2824673 RepID=A0A8D5U4Q0_9CREN|nr:hypothetical protein [Stygiolobus caldivivus]BCU68871.1 hypothetical protein KN1_01680 [Stygiolobus caldivivus]
MKRALKISPFFSVFKNGNKYFAYSEASGLVELCEDEFDNLTPVEELKEIRMLIPEEEEKINVVVNKVSLSYHNLINVFNSIEEVPEGEKILVISSSIHFLVNLPISRFKKVLIAYIMDPFRFFIYSIKNNSPCMYEIYLWLKNSRLILDVKIDGVVISEANPTLNSFAELLLLGFSKLLLNSDKFDGKLVYIDVLEGDLIINTPLKIPGCPKCGI